MSKNTVVRFVKTAWATFAWSSVLRPRTGVSRLYGSPCEKVRRSPTKEPPLDDKSKTARARERPHERLTTLQR